MPGNPNAGNWPGPGGSPIPGLPPFDFQQRFPTAPQTPRAASFVAGDRVKDTAASVTSSLVNLNNTPPASFKSFQDGVGDGNWCFYVLTDGTNEEVQYGQYSNSAKTLTRSSSPISSSTSKGAQVSFTGTVTVFGNWPAGAAMGMNWGVAGGNWIAPAFRGLGSTGVFGSAANPSDGNVFYTPFFVPAPFSSLSIKIANISTAVNGASADLGLYSNRAGAPYALLGQQTGISLAATGAQSSSPIQIGPSSFGLYWAAIVVRGGGTTLQGQRMDANVTTGAIDIIGSATGATNSFGKNGYYENGLVLPLLASPTLLTFASGNFPISPTLLLQPSF